MITRFYLTCIFLCATCILSAQEYSWMNIADSFYNQGKYFEASVYCERVLFAQEGGKAAEAAVFMKIGCYKQQQQFSKIPRFVQTVQPLFTADSLQQALAYETALAYYLSGDFDNALAVADRAVLRFTGKHVERWTTLLSILSLNELRRWQDAAAIADKAGFGGDSVQQYYAKLPRLKSEDRAAWLATFIPGGGHFYVGKTAEGLASIGIQALGVYYGIISWQQKHYLSAWLIGAGVAGSFHFGGVRRSQELVRIYNNRKAAAFNEQVKQKLLTAF